MIKCAICHQIKGKTNHWWTLVYNTKTRSFFEFPFEVDLEDGYPVGVYTKIHTCGIEHLLIAESKIRHGQNPERLVVE